MSQHDTSGQQSAQQQQTTLPPHSAVVQQPRRSAARLRRSSSDAGTGAVSTCPKTGADSATESDDGEAAGAGDTRALAPLQRAVTPPNITHDMPRSRKRSLKAVEECADDKDELTPFKPTNNTAARGIGAAVLRQYGV